VFILKFLMRYFKVWTIKKPLNQPFSGFMHYTLILKSQTHRLIKMVNEVQ
jgi:hypothetical protein